jgi:hypothetical protein
MDAIDHMCTSAGQLKTVNECPFCQSDSRRLNTLNLLGLTDCATYRCDGCGVRFRHPLPDPGAVARYYSSHCVRHPEQTERTIAEIQTRWIADALREDGIELDSVHYLEFGAGRGWLVWLMGNQKVASAVGYEPDRESAQWGREHLGIDLREGSLADALGSGDSPPGGTTVLALSHVLEHLHSPIEVLSRLKSHYSSPYLFLDVPDAEWEGPIIEMDTFPHSSMGQHFWSFSEQSLRILLEKTGFDIIACAKDGKPGFWEARQETLIIWRCISDHYRDWCQNGLSVKRAAVASLKIAAMCFSTGIRSYLRRLRKRKYSRLDLPVIRIFAKVKL